MCVCFEKVSNREVLFADYPEKGIGGMGTDGEVCEIEVEDRVDDCTVFCFGACDDVLPRGCVGLEDWVNNWVHSECMRRKGFG